MDNLIMKNPQANDGETPFHLAAQNGHFKVCKIIINNLVMKNPPKKNGSTPLHLAAM